MHDKNIVVKNFCLHAGYEQLYRATVIIAFALWIILLILLMDETSFQHKAKLLLHALVINEIIIHLRSSSTTFLEAAFILSQSSIVRDLFFMQ